MSKLELKFYERPFHNDGYGSWVWDAKGNFVFQLEKPFSRDKELMEKIIFRLNALDKNKEEIPDLKLSLENPIEIFSDGQLFITIRGWGGLTGIGGHRFSSEKASQIQDDFCAWLIDRLTLEKPVNELEPKFVPIMLVDDPTIIDTSTVESIKVSGKYSLADANYKTDKDEH